jgi:heme oxygenase
MFAQALDQQHRTLDRALADVEYFAHRRNFAVAARQFSRFRHALEAHLEEEVGHDPVALQPEIRAQHVEVAASLAALDRALGDADYAQFCTRLDVFVKQLAEHEAAEERAHSTS